MQRTVHPINFRDFSGEQFERLCFAFLLRQSFYTQVEWYGQLGSDRGRDIMAVRARGGVEIIQCANYAVLTVRKVTTDIEKILSGPYNSSIQLLIMTGGKVSAATREKLFLIAESKGVSSFRIMSGVEFEERLRIDAPDLLERFVGGAPFPEIHTAEQQSELASRRINLAQRELLRKLLIFLEDRRVLFPGHGVRVYDDGTIRPSDRSAASLIAIRERLTSVLEEFDWPVNSQIMLSEMRASCHFILDLNELNDAAVSKIYRHLKPSEGPFRVLWCVMGVNLQRLCKLYDLIPSGKLTRLIELGSAMTSKLDRSAKRRKLRHLEGDPFEWGDERVISILEHVAPSVLRRQRPRSKAHLNLN